LQSHKHVTLQLVWEEYRQAHPDSHDYSRFCDLYRSWLQKRNLVLRHQHRAGEKLFVDHAGDTIPLTNPETGEITAAYLFVAVLGASSYTYAEATQFRDLPNSARTYAPSNIFPACPRLSSRQLEDRSDSSLSL
jgi:transposase